ncbi:MAG: NAD-dependent epimerase/dehydratase family protein [Planctomycetes bacterium]|nr:NAD-dependent epimerase/dehydratase family protein [Planctomycetota bacterium]
MRKPAILITGASGEIGHGLVEHFAANSQHDVVALDLKPLEAPLGGRCTANLAGDILDQALLQRIAAEHDIHEIYHLAALLSTSAERAPAQAHQVNVGGTLNLLHLAHEHSRRSGHPVKLLFPSSIAAYGMPDRATKAKAGKVKEHEFNAPSTMYGCNKLYCEHLGRYFTLHFQQLARDRQGSGVDFRGLRFPGLISAFTMPTGGTSDYAPEMIHAAAKGAPYRCFVDEEARLPFMAMPDAITALTKLAAAPAGQLRLRTYNIGAFSVSARELHARVVAEWPKADVAFARDPARGGIVDSWPGDVDDTAARRDWGWQPAFDFERAMKEYLIPNVRAFYAKR